MRQATSKDAFLTKPRFSVSANVDFDGDGHIDTAQMVNNSRQGAVFVTFGGPNRRAPALAFKIDRPFTGGEEIRAAGRNRILRSEEHTSELQSLMRISYAVFCLKKKKKHTQKQ